MPGDERGYNNPMRISLILIVSLLFVPITQTSVTATEFRAGAAVIDITPTELPVIVNGSMLSRIAKEVITRLHARAIVLDDGNTRLAIVVTDSCMMPRDLLDEV